MNTKGTEGWLFSEDEMKKTANEITPEAASRIRFHEFITAALLRMETLQKFSDATGIPRRTLEGWNQGRYFPKGIWLRDILTAYIETCGPHPRKKSAK